jgi:hypothetical protein
VLLLGERDEDLQSRSVNMTRLTCVDTPRQSVHA